ncbi:MAG: hypothetical protein WCV55_01850 [Candidatus Paceibacterota bacterium]
MKIGIDFDDCLVNYFPPLIEHLNNVFGTTYEVRDIFSFDLEKVWKVDSQTMRKSLADFYLYEKDLDIQPVNGALDAIRKLKEKNELIIITGRPDSTYDFVHGWLEKHLPNTFDKIIFTNQFFGARREKVSICIEEGVGAFIDDNLQNVLDTAKERIIKCFLMDASWNQEPIPEYVSRVKSWEEIVDGLNLY